MLNSDAIRAGRIPCETNPSTGGLSTTLEPFHADAKVTVGLQKNSLRHVCEPCAARHHQGQRQRSGIYW